MSDAARQDALIRALSAEVRPVRRLAPPWRRAMGWIAVVLALAAALAAFADLGAMWRRLTLVPDMWLGVTGSSLTALLAAFAAFETSVPDRRPAWVLLPAPALLLWIGASGFGCLRGWLVPAVQGGVVPEERDCLVFIVGISVPLSALLVLMLRRACPLRPSLTAALGGLAAAAAAATLLNFFHPYDTAATDLAVHLLAVVLVIGANRALGGRLLSAAPAAAPAGGA